MRRFESPYLADLIVVSLRWVTVVALVSSLGLGERLELLAALPLAFLLLGNLVMTALTALSMRLPYHREINFGMDLLVAGAFFWLQGGLQGPASWVGFLPILSGSVYFELIGGLVAAALFSGILVLDTLRTGEPIQAALLVALLMLALGALFGWIGGNLMQRLRRLRDSRRLEEDGRRRSQADRLRAIYEHTSMLSSTLNYKRVLDSALDLASSSIGEDANGSAEQELVGAALLFQGGRLQIGSASGLPSIDLKLTFDGSQGILKTALDEGESVLSNEVATDPELSRVVAFHSCASAYCFPLRSGPNVYGALLFAHPSPGYFTSDRRDLLEILGRQAVIAIQNARLYQDLVEEKERMVEVHEEARKKLARDLHDGPTQSIAAMAMRINLARRMLARDPANLGQELARIEELAHRTSKEMRHMLFTLRPLILESQGLKAALQAMADKTMEVYRQQIVLKIDEQIAQQLEVGKQGVVFYIVEEAVNNARKHANASTITVRLIPAADEIALLEVQDDGVGFDLKSVTEGYDQRSSSSMGMVNLRERAELVNGALRVDSAPGQGTRVQVYVPLTEAAADRLYHSRAKRA